MAGFEFHRLPVDSGEEVVGPFKVLLGEFLGTCVVAHLRKILCYTGCKVKLSFVPNLLYSTYCIKVYCYKYIFGLLQVYKTFTIYITVLSFEGVMQLFLHRYLHLEQCAACGQFVMKNFSNSLLMFSW